MLFLSYHMNRPHIGDFSPQNLVCLSYTLSPSTILLHVSFHTLLLDKKVYSRSHLLFSHLTWIGFHFLPRTVVTLFLPNTPCCVTKWLGVRKYSIFDHGNRCFSEPYTAALFIIAKQLPFPRSSELVTSLLEGCLG